MSKEEIMLGIKQAIERGYSLEQAKQSFINAGYNLQDVEDSARALTGILSQMQPTQPQHPQKMQTTQTLMLKPIQPQQTKQPAAQTTKPIQPQQKPKILITFLFIILLFLLTGLSVIIISKEKVIEYLVRIFA